MFWPQYCSLLPEGSVLLRRHHICWRAMTWTWECRAQSSPYLVGCLPVLLRLQARSHRPLQHQIIHQAELDLTRESYTQAGRI